MKSCEAGFLAVNSLIHACVAFQLLFSSSLLFVKQVMSHRYKLQLLERAKVKLGQTLTTEISSDSETNHINFIVCLVGREAVRD